MNRYNAGIREWMLSGILLAVLFAFAFVSGTRAEIVINKNIYGGGEGSTATVSGDARVSITEGVIKTSVFGGAYMADVDGYTFVWIHDNGNGLRPVVANVYGGNDIAGVISNKNKTMPYSSADTAGLGKLSYVPNAFVKISQYSAVKQGAFVGELYGGGNGNYVYTPNAKQKNMFDVTVDGKTYTVSSKPNLPRTLLDVRGGTIGHMYGGGKNATVTASTDIWLHENENIAPVTLVDTCFIAKNPTNGFIDVPEGFTSVSGTGKDSVRFDYQVTRLFGGNNLTDMSIRPTWHLAEGTVNRLYSGGNRGDMTHPNGIYLFLNSAKLTVNNVFGGCRLSDVNPGGLKGSGKLTAETLDGYEFSTVHSARLHIHAGKINNVYGGNDISGNVYYGSELAIESDIIKDVYGGGNGSYAYYSTDAYKNSDYYFDAQGKTGKEALAILNEHRPNCENVLMHLFTKHTNDTLFVGGSVYCGGNSATLKKIGGSLDDAKSEVRFGSHVILNSLFLGSNGAELIAKEIVSHFNDDANVAGVDLTQKEQFDEYLKAVEVSIRPVVSIDDDYQDKSSYIGSMYCGGNVGSMSAAGTFKIDFLNSLVIFDKLVAGCNDADVAYRADTNAYHQGGILNHADTKIELNLSGLTIEPKKLEYKNGHFKFSWNKIEAGKFYGKNKEINGDYYKGFLYGGNVYGGCYASGHVDGGVRINITDDVVSDDLNKEFRTLRNDAGQLVDKDGHVVTKPVYGPNDFDWDHHVYEPLLSTLTCYGGGYGEDTEIWGNTEINILNNGHILKARAGSERGWIGKMKRSDLGALVASAEPFVVNWYNGKGTTNLTKYEVLNAYNSSVKIDANLLDSAGAVYNNVGEIVAGGFEGVVTGNTTADIVNGCVYTVFGGASNAHIYGAAEVYLGRNDGFPYVSQTVYGGNDFGGQIMGSKVHDTGNTATGSVKKVRSNSYVEYIRGEIGYGTGESVSDTVSVDFGIFGGAYGFYDYRYDPKYSTACQSQPNMMTVLEPQTGEDLAVNCFVNISSKSTSPLDCIKRVYGGGQGYPGQMGLACCHNTYVLLNAKNAAERGGKNNYIVDYVYGGGDCSLTNHTRVDAYAGYVEQIFGACRGRGIEDECDETQYPLLTVNPPTYDFNNPTHYTKFGQIPNLTYQGKTTTVNVYPSMNSPQTDVFGGGAYSGVKEATVNLYGGKIRDVYGASFNEGITYLTQVNVPSDSKAAVNAIYGGGKGNSRAHACDAYISIVDYQGTAATVKEAVYGGNNEYRFTRNSYLNIGVPVYDDKGSLVDVYGAGKGGNTVAIQTEVNLLASSMVNNVYGGGQNGRVFNRATAAHFIKTEDYYGENLLTNYADVKGFQEWKSSKTTSIKGLVTPSDLKNLSLTTDTVTPTEMNTRLYINAGSTVAVNAYGAGLGADAVVAGQTMVELLGGTVVGNIYGGGNNGAVAEEYTKTAMGSSTDQTYATNLYLLGGTTANSYGGGLNGQVIGNANTVMGRGDCGTTAVTYLDGDPAVQRSLYGGGENGAVDGTANMTIYNGHVGYKYDATQGTEHEEHYLTNVDYVIARDSILEHNGNVFGGGYGEGANTVHTDIVMYDGTVRGSVHGGGEIASIGYGTVDTTGSPVIPPLKKITKAGSTLVTMYGGHVQRNVFGGGRGYSFDLKGAQVIGNKFYTDGYVFGTTDVEIRGGEIGTDAGVKDGYGNVFGGGDVGFVYSALGKKQKTEATGRTVGYYYDSTQTASNVLTEDCRVVIAPYCIVTDAGGVTINNVHYDKCQYVPNDQLNYLLSKTTDDSVSWNKIDYLTGVKIHNAIFAGGNVSRGDDKLYANTTTIYGNATATLSDIYHRDLITVGSDYVGGLYGDGNLTLVDGYREICIINYGTDYYSLKQKITESEYENLNDRERAYFQLMWECKTAYDSYTKGQRITQEVYNLLPVSEKVYWERAGFCSIYAGRLLNTVQRADFVGVHGSRLVLQGAQDRVLDVMDYTNYAINRVGEVSLNQRRTVIESGKYVTEDEKEQMSHGNYFGMYNVVNYLEALTSDVDFNSNRTTTSQSHPLEELYPTYYKYKYQYRNMGHRNNATSPNKIALNAGVYLELTTQESKPDSTVYGPITGVIELALMNLGEDMGGAFVYAKNIHGKRSGTMNEQAILSSYNAGAKTNRGFTYVEGTDSLDVETSGNFVNPDKQIIDDCYPGSSDLKSPGHYWFLRGSVYIYDQYISAHTGSSTAYKADTKIPLTITAGAHGKLSVVNIQPNLYAYYKADNSGNLVKLGKDDKFIANAISYHLNDVITYWEWSQLNPTLQRNFVRDTYIVTSDCKYLPSGASDSVSLAKGDVMLSTEYAAIPEIVVSQSEEVSKSLCIHISNATSHTNGYALTADITTPSQWNDRFIKKNDYVIKTTDEYERLTDAQKLEYIEGPSYRSAGGVYGQTQYFEENIISKTIYDAYMGITEAERQKLTGQAKVEQAYLTTSTLQYTLGDTTSTLERGSAISVSLKKRLVNEAHIATTNFDVAYVCNGTFSSKKGVYYVTGDLITAADFARLESEDQTFFTQAYICTKEGLFGGSYYEGGRNYDALEAWCSLSSADRKKFSFNYDAFDLFIRDLDPNATISQYDTTSGPYTPYYCRELPIEYIAVAVKDTFYNDKDGHKKLIKLYPQPDTISSVNYDLVPNEKLHYVLFNVEHAGDKVYFVTNPFTYHDSPYSIGQTLNADDVKVLKHVTTGCIDSLTFASAGKYYYCKQDYFLNENGNGVGVTSLTISSEKEVQTTGVTKAINEKIEKGMVISYEDYKKLPNLQSCYRITGTTPTETSTLYVARDANMYDVIKDRVITLIYKYQYDETTTDGTVSTVDERHIVNIHLQFKSGAPSIGTLRVPGAVLPGTAVGLKQPSVNQGAYEIIGGGWEIYNNESDAFNHVNGTPYKNNSSLLYFYQDGSYVAYYAKTYLGKTYSNAVPFSVANYHDINKVLSDEHHMYIDNKLVPRNPKIYISDDVYTEDAGKSEIDLLRDLYDLSMDGTTFNDQIKGLSNLDFILEEDVTAKYYTSKGGGHEWTPLGTSTTCFGEDGYFHGDGHSISGLDHSLFGYLCADVYNLGVRGSFASPGIADNGGSAHNCWVWTTTATSLATTEAVMGTGTIDNCYYPTTNSYKSGIAVAKPERAFMNGEVAYDLNKYYLNKRYCDVKSSSLADPVEYHFFNINTSDKLVKSTGKYAKADAPFRVKRNLPAEATDSISVGYVEFRFADGDFVNAGGVMPTLPDERRDSEGNFYPIWPDDYIFFGQHLTYGMNDQITHDEWPSAIVKTSAKRMLKTGEEASRVMRAPAYFGNKNINVAHFNPYAILPGDFTLTNETVVGPDTIDTHYAGADRKGSASYPTVDGNTVTVVTKDTIYDGVKGLRIVTVTTSVGRSFEAYPGMTAIDFTGTQDTEGYTKGTSTKGIFYSPILDYTTLSGFNNSGQTQNMLVYASSSADAKSYDVLEAYLTEPEYTIGDATYNNVEKVSDAVVSSVHGHLIDKSSGSFVAPADLFLVDKQTFNAPMGYKMASGMSMWYQRTPDLFITKTGGWETISLPFESKLVSASDKGELTHFFGGSSKGHEYWIREYNGQSKTPTAEIFFANMQSPAKATGTGTYSVDNDFLYDYYYSESASTDANSEGYQTYYKDTREYTDYPFAAANKPYLIGFPGVRYREFDLSGEFAPEDVTTSIKKLSKQALTFKSAEGILVGVTDDVLSEVSKDNYVFVPVFKEASFTASGDAGYYVMNASGSKFDKCENDTVVLPFRAYFKASGKATKSVVFQMSGFDPETPDVKVEGELKIWYSAGQIYVESSFDEPQEVRIFSTTGQLIKRFTIAPEETVETPVYTDGVYLINGHKLMVRQN